MHLDNLINEFTIAYRYTDKFAWAIVADIAARQANKQSDEHAALTAIVNETWREYRKTGDDVFLKANLRAIKMAESI